MTSVMFVGVVPSAPSTTPPPCTAEPDRWFDRADRTHALAACLACPARRWCAQEALRTHASWGMWAGIWIDGAPADVSDRLLAIAADPAPRGVLAEKCDAPTEQVAPRPSAPWLRSRLSARPGSARAAVLARSSGHCEILAADCRFTAETHLSRLPTVSVNTATSAAALYAACHPCAEKFAAERYSAESRRLGYVIDSPGQLEAVPFYWRHARWVLFDRRGQLEQTSVAEQCARAS